MHPNSMNQCEAFRDGLLMHWHDKPLRIADVGANDINGCYRGLFARPGWEYVGFDIVAARNVDCVLPLDSQGRWILPEEHREAFDVVVSGQCMEHVAAPWRWIHDVTSLCKPDGLIWLSVPNTEVFHEHPIDAWRCWPAGMSEIFREARLQEIFCRVAGPDTVGLARVPA